MNKVVMNDPIFVKCLERKLKRKLTRDELLQSEFEVKFSNGSIEWIVIPKIMFPYDLLSRPDQDVIDNMPEKQP